VVEDLSVRQPFGMFHIGDLIEMNTTLLHCSAQTKSIMSINILILNGHPGLSISVKSVKELREPWGDAFVGRRTKEVEFTDSKEVILLHLHILSGCRRVFFVVQKRHEQIALEVLTALGRAPVAGNAEGVLQELGIEEVRSHLAGDALENPESAVTIVTTLHTSKRDEFGDVVPVLHEHSTSNKATLRVANKDETILECFLILGNDVVQNLDGVINLLLKALLAGLAIIHVQSKERMARLIAVQFFLHLVELNVGAGKAMHANNGLISSSSKPCKSKHNCSNNYDVLNHSVNFG